MKSVFSGLESALGHRFAKPELLLRALTHRSLANQEAAETGAEKSLGSGDNERLEFLGDAVLGLVVGEALFAEHPDWREGELTRVRSQLVSRQHMTDVALRLGLADHLRLSRGEDRSGLRHKATVLSNAMEAVLGALYLDGGLEPVQSFARRWILGDTANELAEQLRSGAALGNFKSALQEHLQAARTGVPIYRLQAASGPDHRKRFVVEVCLNCGENNAETVLASGTGTTKKHAEQDAARRALEALTRETAQAGSASGGTNQP